MDKKLEKLPEEISLPNKKYISLSLPQPKARTIAARAPPHSPPTPPACRPSQLKPGGAPCPASPPSSREVGVGGPVLDVP